MKLPYADEIAKHRAAQRAVLPKAKGYRNAQTAKVELEEVRTQIGYGLTDPGPLPGEEEVRAAGSLHPDLVDLDSMFITTNALQARVVTRGAQLDLMMQTLWPFVSESGTLDEVLKDLWHKQAEASAAPEYAETKQRVAARMAQQAYLAEQIPSLYRARSTITQILGTIEYQIPLLKTALITASRSDDPRLPHRASVLALEHRKTVLEIVDHRDSDLVTVPEPAVPDTPHARHNLRLRREAGAVLAWMQTVDATQAERLSTIENRLREITEETALVQAAIEDLTG